MLRLPLNLTFILASCTLILVFMTSGAPISLFNIYRIESHLTNADLGMVSLGYFFSAACALLMFGRLSNALGRKPMTLVALFCVIASCVLLMNMHSVSVLFVARLLQGFACGVASSSVGAYVVDTSVNKPRWLVASITSTAPMIGISSGAISSGALATWGPSPRILIFAVLLSVLLICFALVCFSPETIKRTRMKMSLLRPHLYFPSERKWAFLTTCCVVVSTWSLGAFYQAFGPSIVAEKLGTTQAIVSALAFSSVMILTPFGGYFISNMASTFAVRLGMTLFISAALSILLALNIGSLTLFLGASLLAGAAQGVATTACLKVLLHNIEQEHRAGLLSTIFVISYSGAVLPGIFASAATQSFSVFQICIGYVALAASVGLMAIFISAKLKPFRSEKYTRPCFNPSESIASDE